MLFGLDNERGRSTFPIQTLSSNTGGVIYLKYSNNFEDGTGNESETSAHKTKFTHPRKLFHD